MSTALSLLPSLLSLSGCLLDRTSWQEVVLKRTGKTVCGTQAGLLLFVR